MCGTTRNLAGITALVWFTVGPMPRASAQLIVAGADAQHQALGIQTQFESVGWLQGVSSNSSGYIAGAATLIHPQYVLFAAHQLLSTGAPASALSFSLSTQIFAQAPNFAAIDEWWVHPSFNNMAGLGYDLAIGRLSSPITTVTPAQINTGSVAAGTEVQFASYGVKVEHPNMTSPYDGIKRGGTNIVDGEYAANPNYFRMGFSPAVGGLNTPFEMNLTNFNLTNYGGGSGIFDAAGSLIGVSSFNAPGLLDSFAISLDVPWVNSFIVVPEPSSSVLALAAVGFGAAAKWRRRVRKVSNELTDQV